MRDEIKTCSPHNKKIPKLKKKTSSQEQSELQSTSSGGKRETEDKTFSGTEIFQEALINNWMTVITEKRWKQPNKTKSYGFMSYWKVDCVIQNTMANRTIFFVWRSNYEEAEEKKGETMKDMNEETEPKDKK